MSYCTHLLMRVVHPCPLALVHEEANPFFGRSILRFVDSGAIHCAVSKPAVRMLAYACMYDWHTRTRLVFSFAKMVT